MASTTTEPFSWIPPYQELAGLLVPWREKQEELITFLERLREGGCAQFEPPQATAELVPRLVRREAAVASRDGRVGLLGRG